MAWLSMIAWSGSTKNLNSSLQFTAVSFSGPAGGNDFHIGTHMPAGCEFRLQGQMGILKKTLHLIDI